MQCTCTNTDRGICKSNSLTKHNVVMRDQIFSNINDFLTRGNDVSCKATGMLLLYVPWEGTQITQMKQSLEMERESVSRMKHQKKQRDLIKRLEKVSMNWIQRIRESLIIFPTPQDKLYDVTSEFAFWKNRYENLVSLSSQLNSEGILLISEQLKRVQSLNAEELKNLTSKVNESLEECKSNLTYLDILVETCNLFTHPNQVHDCLPNILYTVRFIWSESTHYSVSGNVERLLCSISICIIKICINNIDLKLMFKDVKECRETIQISFACLLYYSQIYDHIIGNTIGNTDNWNVDKDKVFNCINAFKQRCQDVSEICDAIKLYGSSTKVNFDGTRGNDHETQFRHIKEYFSEIINEMQFIILDYSLDITEVKWFRYMLNFRSELEELENTVSNLLNSLFEDVVSVEMGIETLYTLFKFRERKHFADILRNKWTEVWKMFSEEIKLSSEESIKYELYQDKAKLLRSEQSTISNINEKYLKKLYEMMINASDWLGDCDLQNENPLKNFSRKMSNYSF